MYLELDVTRLDGCPELIVRVGGPEDVERSESEAELSVGGRYRAEDVVEFVVGVESSPDGVEEAVLTHRHNEAGRGVPTSSVDESNYKEHFSPSTENLLPITVQRKVQYSIICNPDCKRIRD